VTLKRIRAAAFIAVIALAGVAVAIHAQDKSKKSSAAPRAKTEQACCTKSKEGGKMKCCMMDSTASSKDAKSCCGKMEKR